MMYSKYCSVPEEEIDVCPNVGWVADFGDPQTVLDVHVQRQDHPAGQNVNWGQVNNPKINAAMEKAEGR